MQASLHDYLKLSKAKVVLLMLLTSWVGMYLASINDISFELWLYATLGIALMSGSAATLNHIIDFRFDSLMKRTQTRPLVQGKITFGGAFRFAFLQGIGGFILLYWKVNTLTAFLTLFAAIGYSAIYSLYLKHATPQNIVIGGLSGAMPPLLGWVAVRNHIDPEAWILVLIIFAWTPAHFWALALHRLHEYKHAALPMLPVTHGVPYTKLYIILYTLLTASCSLLPFCLRMSGNLYLVGAIILNLGFIQYAFKLKFAQENSTVALKTFRYSLVYLAGIFILLLLDHHLSIT